MFVLWMLACMPKVVGIQPVGEDHYVILDEDGKAWDCKSNPSGEWKPTCVRVEYRDVAPKADTPAN